MRPGINRKGLWVWVISIASILGPPSSGPATADDVDAALYIPAPPADSAFVRFARGTREQEESAPRIDGRRLAPVPFGEAGDYVVVAGGGHRIRFAGHDETVVFAPGGFYTLAVACNACPGGLLVLTDESDLDRAKALLSLYNLGDAASVSLETVEGSLPVIQAITPGAAGSRIVNAIRVSLAATAGDLRIESFPAVVLERGSAYSVLVTGVEGHYSARLVRNRSDLSTR